MRRRHASPYRAPSDPAPTARSVPLLITGGLMLLVVLLLANPWFGTASRSWPWETWSAEDVPLREKAVLGLWTLTGLWTLLLSFGGPVRLRALGAAGLTGLLLLETRWDGAPFDVSASTLGVLVPGIALGGGLWLARSNATRRPGRVLSGIGAVLVVWTLAAAFDGSASRLSTYFSDLEQLFRDWRGDFAPPADLWSSVLPRTLILLAAGYGLLVAFGLSLPRTTTVFFYLLLAALLLPGFVEAFSRQDGSAVDEGPLARLLTYVLAHGCLLWLLGVYALADLMHLRSRETLEVPA